MQPQAPAAFVQATAAAAWLWQLPALAGVGLIAVLYRVRSRLHLFLRFSLPVVSQSLSTAGL